MSIENDKSTFLTALRGLGMVGNTGFRRDVLGWSEPRYWKIHGLLVADEKVTTGRGRGGSIGVPVKAKRAAVAAE